MTQLCSWGGGGWKSEGGAAFLFFVVCFAGALFCVSSRALVLLASFGWAPRFVPLLRVRRTVALGLASCLDAPWRGFESLLRGGQKRLHLGSQSFFFCWVICFALEFGNFFSLGGVGRADSSVLTRWYSAHR